MRDHGQLPRLFKIAALRAWGTCALACLAAMGYVSGSATLIAFKPGWKAMGAAYRPGYRRVGRAINGPVARTP